MNKLLIVNPRSMQSQMSYLHHLNYLSENTSLELYLVCENVDKKLLDKRVAVIEVPRRSGRFCFAIRLYKKAAHLIIKNKIGWVISSYGHFNTLLVLFLLRVRMTNKWKGTLFYDLRSASVSAVMDELQNKLFSIESKFYDYKIAVSEKAAQKVFGKKESLNCFISGVGCFPKKEFLDQADLLQQIIYIKEKYQVTSNTLVLVYIGTLKNRALDKFIELFKFNIKNYCFFIIGDGDKKSEDSLKRAINNKGLPGKIHLLGRVSFFKLPIFLSIANVGIAYVPEHESLSSQPFTKILEYAEFDTLVLASDNLSKNEFINSAEVVFLSNYNSLAKLRKIVEQKKNTLSVVENKRPYWSELSQRLFEYLKKFPVEKL